MKSLLSNAELDSLTIESDTRSGERMITRLSAFLARFVSYPSEHALVAHALWCVHTHLMDRWESTPRMAFLSAEPASGKTRALEITELLVPNPVVAVNVSPTYLFRKVGSEEGVTLLYDEIDTVFGPKARENEELRGVTERRSSQRRRRRALRSARQEYRDRGDPSLCCGRNGRPGMATGHDFVAVGDCEDASPSCR